MNWSQWKVFKKLKKQSLSEVFVWGCHHWLNGHEAEQTSGDGEGQGSLACCSPWGCKELDTTEWLNRTEYLRILPSLTPTEGVRFLGLSEDLGNSCLPTHLTAGFWSVSRAFFRQYPWCTNDTPGTWRCPDRRGQGSPGKKIWLQWSQHLRLLHSQPWSSSSGVPQSPPPLWNVTALPSTCAQSCCL